MNYDIPEIQDNWIPKIGDRVQYRDDKRNVEFIIVDNDCDIDYGLKTIREKAEGSTHGGGKKDLIFIPSIEWFLEKMEIKNPNDLESLEGEFFEMYYDENLEIKNTIDKKEMSYLQFDIPYKDYLFRLFMFKHGKVLKGNEWVALTKEIVSCMKTFNFDKLNLTKLRRLYGVLKER